MRSSSRSRFATGTCLRIRTNSALRRAIDAELLDSLYASLYLNQFSQPHVLHDAIFAVTHPDRNAPPP